MEPLCDGGGSAEEPDNSQKSACEIDYSSSTATVSNTDTSRKTKKKKKKKKANRNKPNAHENSGAIPHRRLQGKRVANAPLENFWASLGQEKRLQLTSLGVMDLLKTVTGENKLTCTCEECMVQRDTYEEELSDLFIDFLDDLSLLDSDNEEYHERPGWMLNEFMGSTHHTDPDGCDFGHHHNDGINEHIPSQIDGDQAVADVPRWCDFTSTLVCEDGFVVLNRALVDNVELVVDLLVGLEESRGRMLLQPSPDGADGPDRRQEDALDELLGTSEVELREDYAMGERVGVAKRMFFVVALKMIAQRIMLVYREKVALDNQDRLIAEEEAEALRAVQKERQRDAARERKKEKRQRQREAHLAEQRRQEDAELQEHQEALHITSTPEKDTKNIVIAKHVAVDTQSLKQSVAAVEIHEAAVTPTMPSAHQDFDQEIRNKPLLQKNPVVPPQEPTRPRSSPASRSQQRSQNVRTQLRDSKLRSCDSNPTPTAVPGPKHGTGFRVPLAAPPLLTTPLVVTSPPTRILGSIDASSAPTHRPRSAARATRGGMAQSPGTTSTPPRKRQQQKTETMPAGNSDRARTTPRSRRKVVQAGNGESTLASIHNSQTPLSLIKIPALKQHRNQTPKSRQKSLTFQSQSSSSVASVDAGTNVTGDAWDSGRRKRDGSMRVNNRVPMQVAAVRDVGMYMQAKGGTGIDDATLASGSATSHATPNARVFNSTGDGTECQPLDGTHERMQQDQVVHPVERHLTVPQYSPPPLQLHQPYGGPSAPMYVERPEQHLHEAGQPTHHPSQHVPTWQERSSQFSGYVSQTGQSVESPPSRFQQAMPPRIFDGAPASQILPEASHVLPMHVTSNSGTDGSSNRNPVFAESVHFTNVPNMRTPAWQPTASLGMHTSDTGTQLGVHVCASETFLSNDPRSALISGDTNNWHAPAHGGITSRHLMQRQEVYPYALSDIPGSAEDQMPNRVDIHTDVQQRQYAHDPARPPHSLASYGNDTVTSTFVQCHTPPSRSSHIFGNDADSPFRQPIESRTTGYTQLHGEELDTYYSTRKSTSAPASPGQYQMHDQKRLYLDHNRLTPDARLQTIPFVPEPNTVRSTVGIQANYDGLLGPIGSPSVRPIGSGRRIPTGSPGSYTQGMSQVQHSPLVTDFGTSPTIRADGTPWSLPDSGSVFDHQRAVSTRSFGDDKTHTSVASSGASQAYDYNICQTSDPRWMTVTSASGDIWASTPAKEL